MNDKPVGLPDYFAMFQSLLKPAAAKGVESMAALWNPKELEKKIGELEIVIAWLRGTTKVLETSVEAMQAQKRLIESVTRVTSRKGRDSEPAAGPAPDLAKLSAALNPAAWAMNFMDAPVETGSRPGTRRRARGKAR